MYGRSDLLGVTYIDAIGTRLLRKTARGNYCNRGQDRNSKRAHDDLSAEEGGEAYSDSTKTQHTRWAGECDPGYN